MSQHKSIPLPILSKTSYPSAVHPSQQRGEGLGPLLTIYRSPSLSLRSSIFLFILVGTSVLTPLGYGLYIVYYGYTKHGLAAAVTWGKAWFLISIITFSLALILILLLRRSIAEVFIYKNGLKLRKSRWSTKIFHWDQLSGISTTIIQENFFNRTLQTRYHATLYPSQGKPVQIDDHLENLPELITRIKAHLYPKLLPKLRTAFKSDERVPFGPIVIQSHSLSIRSQQIPWDQVLRVTVQDARLVIELKNKIYRVPASVIPNLELLFQLIRDGVHP